MLNNNPLILTRQQLLTKIEEKLVSALALDSSLLNSAMRYSTLDGGKRIRPLLVVAGGNLSNANLDSLLSVGIAIELIHCYSLIHDDLPAMDNDDLRRGRPTCHKKYSEAIAILAGDALQAQAFTILSSSELLLSSETKLKIINLVSKCSGAVGMVGGQALDLLSTGVKLDLAKLKQMHSMKTGALIKASILAGYLCGVTFDLGYFELLTAAANNLGLLFQITDDILDATSDTITLGKTANKDLVQDKATYVNILGLSKVENLAASLYNDSLSILMQLPNNNALIELAHLIYKRNN